MLHISTLRLRFFSPSSVFLSPIKFSLPSSSSIILKSNANTPRFLAVTDLLYFHRKNRNFPSTSSQRKNTTLSKSEDKTNNLGMEEKSDAEVAYFGFNKRRAEGKDKSDKPKNLQVKARKLNPANTICYLQILGTGMDTQDTLPSVLLFFDKQRFIFNVGEGLQRFCTEHKIKLSKIDHLFLSRVCSETAGGLPGLLLTLAGMGDEGMSVNIWGPSDLKFSLDAMKSFIPNAAMVHTHSFGAGHHSDKFTVPDLDKRMEPIVLVNDEVVKISALLLEPHRSNESQLMNHESGFPSSSKVGLEEGTEQELPTLYSKRPEFKGGPAVKPGDFSVVYVCELPEIKGKFDLGKAAAFGLKPGPKFAKLKLGKSVMSDFLQIMVHSSDVLEPSIPGPIFLLVDCPTNSHFQKLLSIQHLNCYYEDCSGSSQECSKTVNCVIHLSPASVVENPIYQEWMRRFGAAQHIMAGHGLKNVQVPILASSARISTRLHYLCPQFFPASGFLSLQNDKCSLLDAVTSTEGPDKFKCILAENFLKFHFRPYSHLGVDRSCVPKTMIPSDIINELLSEIPEIVDAAQQVNLLWRAPSRTEEEATSTQSDSFTTEESRLEENALPRCLESVSREDMEIVLLGTGSSQPSKYRNLSSIYIDLFSKGSFLLDCGEGTLAQLKRRYGIEGADNAVKSLRCIWISHIHADHRTGLTRILAHRRDLLSEVPHEPLLVIGPRQLKRYLDAYQKLEDLDMQFLDCRNTMDDSMQAFEEDSESNDHIACPGSPLVAEKSVQNNGVEQINQNIKDTSFAQPWNRSSEHNVVAPIVRNLKKVLSESGLEAMISFPVVHCPQAYGVALKAAERVNNVGKIIPGWKFVYSGDTRPCPEVIKASQGATVLIHEATFEDGMAEEAIARNHSTTKEAMEVGDSAGAYRIILTHFSQRYPKIPVFDENHMHKACIAFDLMSINLADLPLLPKVVPYLKLLFRNEMAAADDDMEDVASVSAAS